MGGKATAVVVSDSHGNFDALYQVMQIIPKPDALLFLGDGYQDFEDLQSVFPDIPMIGVPGNRDFDCTEKDTKMYELAGKQIFLAHGHAHYAKVTIGPLCKAAAEAHAQIALYGHTHYPVVFRDPGGILIMNPGSINSGSYGLLTVDGDSVDAQLCELPRR